MIITSAQFTDIAQHLKTALCVHYTNSCIEKTETIKVSFPLQLLDSQLLQIKRGCLIILNITGS